MITPYLGFDGLALMAEGVAAPDALNRLLERDPGRAYRQCGLVDAEGGSAAWTGPEAPSWAGHRTGRGYSAQENRVVGPQTLDTLVEAFQEAQGRELAERLLLGLEAGASTGGDRQGEVSGAIYVVDTEQYPCGTPGWTTPTTPWPSYGRCTSASPSSCSPWSAGCRLVRTRWARRPGT